MCCFISQRSLHGPLTSLFDAKTHERFIFLNVFFLLRQVKQAVIWALQAGYRHIDCAAIYDNEAEIGEALQETVGPGKVKPHGPVCPVECGHTQ